MLHCFGKVKEKTRENKGVKERWSATFAGLEFPLALTVGISDGVKGSDADPTEDPTCWCASLLMFRASRSCVSSSISSLEDVGWTDG